MIVADALRADAHDYGYKPTVTPTLDALAASGTLLRMPLTLIVDAAAMASIMSSRHVPGRWRHVQALSDAELPHSRSSCSRASDRRGGHQLQP